MAYDEKLAERIRNILKSKKGITERNMFGGLCFLHRGNMCLGVEKDRVVVRVGPHAHDQVLRLAHVLPMDFTGKPLKGFVYVNAKGVSTSSGLKNWIQRGLNFTGTLPAK